MATLAANVDASDVMKDVELIVSVTGVPRLRLRLWLAIRIFRFGAWIAGCGLTFENGERGV